MVSKKIKNFVKFKLSFLSLSIMSLAVIACSSNSNNPVLLSVPENKNSQLNTALSPLVDLYNQQQSSQADFLPVKLLTTEDTKYKNDTELLKGTVDQITKKSNELPSLILSSYTSLITSTPEINKHKKLLDISDVVKPSDFIPGIAPLYALIGHIPSLPSIPTPDAPPSPSGVGGIPGVGSEGVGGVTIPGVGNIPGVGSLPSVPGISEITDQTRLYALPFFLGAGKTFNASSPDIYSLIPITVDSKKDAAVKKFLNWLYKGEVTIDNKKIKVPKYIQDKYQYYLPLKDSLPTLSA
ncbi:hypothetical protein MCAV_04190 [[Mycoplasma] cavipharyngis]|uniref:hypothetical protein n=1 Tax=[Mycoplasma] cavipharyngis TaxID=92757 RepID=UPI00370372F9